MIVYQRSWERGVESFAKLFGNYDYHRNIFPSNGIEPNECKELCLNFALYWGSFVVLKKSY